MAHGLKLALFLLAFNIIGFAEGYLLGACVVGADSSDGVGRGTGDSGWLTGGKSARGDEQATLNCGAKK